MGRKVNRSPSDGHAVCEVGVTPVLIRIETKAGHGAGKPTTKLIEEAAEKWGFLVGNLKIKPSRFAD